MLISPKRNLNNMSFSLKNFIVRLRESLIDHHIEKRSNSEYDTIQKRSTRTSIGRNKWVSDTARITNSSLKRTRHIRSFPPTSNQNRISKPLVCESGVVSPTGRRLPSLSRERIRDYGPLTGPAVLVLFEEHTHTQEAAGPFVAISIFKSWPRLLVTDCRRQLP